MIDCGSTAERFASTGAWVRAEVLPSVTSTSVRRMAFPSAPVESMGESGAGAAVWAPAAVRVRRHAARAAARFRDLLGLWMVCRLTGPITPRFRDNPVSILL